MGEQNGVEKFPAVVVSWNAGAQDVAVQFDPLDFKTWDFVVAVLDMARAKAEGQRRLAQMQAAQRQAQEAAHAEVVRRSLRG